MILVNKAHLIDASCYVVVYESRKIGNSKKEGYVLVGKTETITNEPWYTFYLQDCCIHGIAPNSLNVLPLQTRTKILNLKCTNARDPRFKMYRFEYKLVIYE